MRPELVDAVSEGQAVYWNSSTYVPLEGYGYSFKKYTESLLKVGIHSIQASDFAPELKEAGNIIVYEFINKDGGPPIVNHCLPNSYIVGSGTNIGMTYWETDTVPAFWLPNMRRMDTLWTSSKFIKDVYKKQEANDNISEFHQGIDPDIYKINFDPPQTDKFTFLSFGSPSSRKNAQYTYDAFMDLYEGNKKFHLIIKSSGPCSVRNIKDGTNLGSVSGHPEVTVIEEMLPEEEVAELYRSVHCLVYPTSGEGWGLVPFSAIASGTPTICTNATACTEYAHMSVPLNFEWKSPLDHPGGAHGLYSYGGKWADPDLNDLREKMQSVVENYNSYKNLTITSAMKLQNTHTWDKVALRMGLEMQKLGAVNQLRIS